MSCLTVSVVVINREMDWMYKDASFVFWRCEYFNGRVGDKTSVNIVPDR